LRGASASAQPLPLSPCGYRLTGIGLRAQTLRVSGYEYRLASTAITSIGLHAVALQCRLRAPEVALSLSLGLHAVALQCRLRAPEVALSLSLGLHAVALQCPLHPTVSTIIYCRLQDVSSAVRTELSLQHPTLIEEAVLKD
jgi:hypothetical protein